MYPTTNLQPGQRGPEVEKLQKFLLSEGLLTQAQINTGPGIYGPATTQAVKYWQDINGVDNTSGPGYWGPRSIAAASGNPVAGASNVAQPAEPAQPAAPAQPTPYAYGRAPDDPLNQFNTQTGQPNPNWNGGNATTPNGGSDVPYSEEEYTAALNANPIVQASIAKGNTAEDLAYAAETGDFSGLVNQFGQPFSLEEQQAALKQAEDDNKLYYDALKSKETADAESALAEKKASYQDYLLNSGQQFESDKTASDQNAANRGVLFSGGRVQREKNLARAYQQDQASKLDSLSRDIGDTARDYQYKYGNEAANGLSQYYNLGSNSYNPNVARGGVSSNALSSVYNPNKYNYQGTVNTQKKAVANQRAAGLLWNKGNKLLATGVGNQY